MAEDRNKTVFSTKCSIPKQPSALSKNGKGPEPASLPVSKQRVLARLEKKGRGGKSVTLIEGLQLATKDYDVILKQLKAQLGTGGTVKDGILELQGDCRDKALTFLENLGYRPKRAGG